MRELSPHLSVIEARLHLQGDANNGDADNLSEFHGEAKQLPMPAFFKDAIERTVAAQAIKDAPVEPGTVVLVSAIYDADGQATEQLSAPVAFCLDAKKITRGTDSEWTGWMVSPDCDYATEKDVLLEPNDGPFDPVAGMIQTWNRLTLRIPSRPRVLAKLSNYRLSIIREVETEERTDVPPAPGRIALRVTPTKRMVLTGSPFQTQDDSRVDYQRLYSDLAHAIDLKQVAEIRAEVIKTPQPPAKAGGFIVWLLGHRLEAAGFAATLAGVMVAGHMLLKESEAPGTAPAQVARNETVLTQQPETSATNSGTPPVIGANKETTTAATENFKPPKPLERTELAKLDSSKPKSEPEATHSKTKGNNVPLTEIAKQEDASTAEQSELASLFLSPLKSPSFIVAMRGTKADTASLRAYRLRLKSRANQEAAVTLLDSLGLQVARIDETAGTIDLVADKKNITAELEAKLKASAFFVEARRK
jgi:hypothetical protein